MIKYVLVVIAFIAIITSCLLYLSQRPIAINENAQLVDPTTDPIQNVNFQKENFLIYSGKTPLTVFPKAEYDISARVLHKKSYFGNWTAKISPYDLALGWGQVSSLHNLKFIKISQRSRFYYYKYGMNSPLRKDYISKHSANCHLIPANQNIRKAIRSVKKHDLIRINGYLVFIDGLIRGRKVWWNSSLTRNDTGNGACEIIYVNKIQINEKLYR